MIFTEQDILDKNAAELLLNPDSPVYYGSVTSFTHGSVSSIYDMQYLSNRINMNDLELTEPTLFICEEGLRYILLSGQGETYESQVVIDSYTMDTQFIHMESDNTISIAPKDGSTVGYNLTIDSDVMREDIFFQIIYYINQGDDSKYNVIRDAGDTYNESITATPEGNGLDVYLKLYCNHDSDFQSFIQRHPSKTITQYLESHFGDHETQFAHYKRPSVKNTKQYRILELTAQLAGPDWDASRGELGYIDNKPTIPVVPTIPEVPDFGKLGATIHMAILSDVTAVANRTVPYRTIDQIGDTRGMQVSLGVIKLFKNTGIYLVEASVCGSMTMPSNDFLECIMTRNDNSRIGISLFGFNGGGTGAGRILPNTGTAVIDTAGRDVIFSVKIERALNSSTRIVGDQQDYHRATHGRITRIGF